MGAAEEDEIVRHHRRLSGHEFGQTLGDSREDRGARCAAERGLAKSQM